MAFLKSLKKAVIGRALDLKDRRIFQRISLAAVLAWVGLGADGLASSCYGPQEAYLILGRHTPLALYVALLTALTICIISASYSHIIEVFPTGGGGYTVASTLLSPTTGMVSGCALLVDYLLDITLSLASGTDAIFSFLPRSLQPYKLPFACAAIVAMTLVNLRGVKESVKILLPVFGAFLLTHGLAIVYGLTSHAGGLGGLAGETLTAAGQTSSQLGTAGTIFLVLKAYGMGGGTYTGLEAVSNGLPILQNPKEKTGKRTMAYMAVSLSAVVGGLLVNYLLFKVGPQEGKTLNAVFLEAATQHWGVLGTSFTTFSLVAEAALLVAGAQTGFIDGPRILGYMAEDRWMPIRFNQLSHRLVIRNGVLVLGFLAILVMLATRGRVGMLVVLFSINVFITFVLSQLGMVVHWLKERKQGKPWRRRLLVNGTGCALSALILVTMVIVKFTEGGWATLVFTGTLAVLAYLTKRHYDKVHNSLEELNRIAQEERREDRIVALHDGRQEQSDGIGSDVAAIIVTGFTGFNLLTLEQVSRTFGTTFRKYVFIEVGPVEAEAFKDEQIVAHTERRVRNDLDKFVSLMRGHGYDAEAVAAVSTSLVESVVDQAVQIRRRYPNAMFFGGQVVFPKETILSKLLHNDVVFAVQKSLYRMGIPFFIIPVCLTRCEPPEPEKP